MNANVSADLIANDTLFEVGLDPPVPGQGHPLPNDAFARWAIGPKSMFLKFSDPTVLNLGNKQFDPNYVVIPKDYPAGSWIYMVIYTNSSAIPKNARRIVPAAHPVSSITSIAVILAHPIRRFIFMGMTLLFSNSPLNPSTSQP